MQLKTIETIILNYKEHWDKVYSTKTPEQVSWTQAKPTISLQFIEEAGIGTSANIIDIGGGDSKLVDYLLEAGYTNITVLDISEHAIERAKKRLGKKADNVKWIVSNILDFEPKEHYDLWHDRATFHFMTTPAQIERYLELISKSVHGNLILGTFSEEGPKMCSGLPITQYNQATLSRLLSPHFELKNSITEDHITPFDTQQNFLFCSFISK